MADDSRIGPAQTAAARRTALPTWVVRHALARGSRRRPRSSGRVRRCACSTLAAASSRTTRSSRDVASEYIGVDVVENPAAELLGPVEALPVDDGASTSFSAPRCSSTRRPAQAVRELRRVTRRAGAFSPRRTACRSTTRRLSTTGAGRTKGCGGCSGEREWSSSRSSPRRGPLRGSRCCSGRSSRSRCGAPSSRGRPSGSLNRPARRSTHGGAAARAGSGIADPELPRRRDRLMRLLRRNTLGVYGSTPRRSFPGSSSHRSSSTRSASLHSASGRSSAR